MKFGLTDSALVAISKVFKNHPEVKIVKIFGSRVMGNYRDNSDIDFALWGDVDYRLLGRVLLELDELPLPFQFEVKLYDHINHIALKQHIDKHGVVFYDS